MARVRRVLGGLLTVAVLAGACEPSQVSPVESPGNTSGSGPTSQAAFRPSMASTPCPNDVTSDIVVVISCSYLTVLEDRGKPAGRTIQLFVARFDPPGGTTTPDPLITIGGLGEGLDYAGMAPSGQRTHRVLYLLDPRGIGHSKPSLACPEVAAVGPDVAGFRLRDPARQSKLLDSVRACRDRLVSDGVDLAAYNLAENANDMDDLRATLGIATWNIGTNGSASRIAFEVARRFPGSVRSMAVDSPNVPSPDFLTIAPKSLDLAIQTLGAWCSAEAACASRFPNLPETIRKAAARLDDNPIRLEVTGSVAAVTLGHPIPVVVDGAAFIRAIRFALGSQGGAGASHAVATIRAVTDGTLSASDNLVLALASDQGDCLGLLPLCEVQNLGATYSLICRDIAPAVETSALATSTSGRRSYADIFAPSPLLTPCGTWGVAAASADASGSPTGGTPTLVLRGVLDPYSTAMSDVRTATAGSPDVYFVDIPNQSYNVLGYTECVRRIRSAWMDAPTAPPADTSCLAAIPAFDLTP